MHVVNSRNRLVQYAGKILESVGTKLHVKSLIHLILDTGKIDESLGVKFR